jgi:hypothetical protein
VAVLAALQQWLNTPGVAHKAVALGVLAPPALSPPAGGGSVPVSRLLALLNGTIEQLASGKAAAVDHSLSQAAAAQPHPPTPVLIPARGRGEAILRVRFPATTEVGLWRPVGVVVELRSALTSSAATRYLSSRQLWGEGHWRGGPVDGPDAGMVHGLPTMLEQAELYNGWSGNTSLTAVVGNGLSQQALNWSALLGGDVLVTTDGASNILRLTAPAGGDVALKGVSEGAGGGGGGGEGGRRPSEFAYVMWLERRGMGEPMGLRRTHSAPTPAARRLSPPYCLEIWPAHDCSDSLRAQRHPAIVVQRPMRHHSRPPAPTQVNRAACQYLHTHQVHTPHPKDPTVDTHPRCPFAHDCRTPAATYGAIALHGAITPSHALALAGGASIRPLPPNSPPPFPPPPLPLNL